MMWYCANSTTRDVQQKQNLWSLYQILNSLRIPSLEFFVRSAEILPCPCCGERLTIIGSRLRKCIKGSGETIILNIRRLRCVHCKQIHHELPDFIVPYKRYEVDCIENVVSDQDLTLDIATDECTLYRWKRWFETLSPYLAGCLISLSGRLPYLFIHPLFSDFCGGFVRGSTFCTPTNWTFCRRRSPLAGESCPTDRKFKFMDTYPFCISVRIFLRYTHAETTIKGRGFT